MDLHFSKEKKMVNVLLINQEKIDFYRIPVYNYLSAYLKKRNISITIISCGIPAGNTHKIDFNHREFALSFQSISKYILKCNPDVIISWVRLRHLYLFPVLFLSKLFRKKVIYWGHGSDLARQRFGGIRKLANNIEFWICDALILYGGHLKKYVNKKFYHKTFIANNTLYFSSHRKEVNDRNMNLSKYNIKTSKNIICMGRMQKRKRLDNLFKAFKLIDRHDIGLIFVGPDSDGILEQFHGENIYKFGPIYGDEKLDLLSVADVFCLPGAVGLSIVDAFQSGLPFVTEEGEVSPEIMYLKDGVNGFVVQKGGISELADKLQLLLDDEALRIRFSQEAKREIETNGHIDRLCEGFNDALRYVVIEDFNYNSKES